MIRPIDFRIGSAADAVEAKVDLVDQHCRCQRIGAECAQ
jgi:hypothetical protein